MWSFLLLLLQAAQPAPNAQPAAIVTRYQVLAAEYLREAGVPVLAVALQSPDTLIQRLAVRAVGRLENPQHAGLIEPLLTSPSASVRTAVIAAAAQMHAPIVSNALVGEKDPAVRAEWYAAAGRVMGASVGSEAELVHGLSEPSTITKRGAARGLESMIRLNASSFHPSPATIAELRRTVVQAHDSELRLLAMRALFSAHDRDSLTIGAALRDTSAQVRGTAVLVGRVWQDDPSPIVRVQALLVAATCERAAAAVRDTSESVALLAIDQLGSLKCNAALLGPSIMPSTSWRRRAHATVSLAKTDPAAAHAVVRSLAASPVWQARAWAAQAARIIDDRSTLTELARDTAPNVVIAAMTTPAEALRALGRDHAGLVLAASQLLAKSTPFDTSWSAPLRASFARLAIAHGVTWRDPRVGIIKAMRGSDGTTLLWLGECLYDADPAVARAAADQIKVLGGSPVEPVTRTYAPPPFPSEQALTVLDGATATVTIRGKGAITVRFYTDIAPVTVYSFAQLATSGRYNGNTIHRIVPNFVVQGGSPGADEYDPVASAFIRDEVGGENLRGTFGMSTRGRDTGDGQFYINLIDNVRLDGDYTVFGVVIAGRDVVDRIQEGDVIDSVVIHPNDKNHR
ncbi:MAG: peptidylprolyl isomerase [Gemmatimonadaceae bacterium]